MSMHPLICRECFSETDVRTATDQSQSTDEAQSSVACPNCGSSSFGI